MATTSRQSVMKWLGLGTLVAIALAAIAIVAWPASAADTAYDDGVRVGNAVNDLRNAETYEDVDQGLTDLRHAVRDAQDHAGDELDEQITKQQDAFFDAMNGAVGANTTDSGWDQDIYESQFDDATDALVSNADDFRTNGPDVVQSFWNGVEDGLNS
jgi:hypothetical protein